MGIFRFLRLQRGLELEAPLTGVSGFTGGGAVEYAENRNGERRIGVKLRGVAGRSADIFYTGRRIANIRLENGHAAIAYSSRRGHKIPPFESGGTITIVQNGDAILTGVLKTD